MGSSFVTNPAIFLISTLFDLYLIAVMLRFLLQLVRADFYNPVCQFLVKVTNPPLVPLRRILPGLGGIDLAAVVLMLVIAAIELFIVSLLRGFAPPMLGLLIHSIAKIATLFIYIYIFSILIQVIISWINPGAYNPVTSLLYQLNEPLLRPIRRLIPPISGFDLSPLFALIGLQLLAMILQETFKLVG